MRRRLIYLASAFILLLLVYKLYQTSYIEISADGPTSGFRYTLTNQNSGKQRIIDNASSHLKVRLPKANYGVLVQKDNTSHYAVVSTGHFLKTTKIEAKLQPEKKRRFVGNNPLPCMDYLKNRLISYQCDAYYSNVRSHIPATATTPTYVLNNTGSTIDGYMEGTVKTKDGTVALIRKFIGEDTQEGVGNNYYSIYRINSRLQALDKSVLSNLDATKAYAIKAYGDGFILYDSKFESITAYSSWRLSPKTLAIEGSKEKEVFPTSLAVSGQAILKVYNRHEGRLITEVVVFDDGRSTHYVLPETYAEARLCGQHSLCVMGDKRLDVYALDAGKAKLQYRLAGVESMETDSGDLLLGTLAGVLNFDVDKRSGFLEYSLGSYGYNGLTLAANGYLLNLDNDSGQVALYVDRRRSDSDNIDKKIAELQNNPAISALSAYGKYIYITPDAGPLVYNQAIQDYTYDRQAVQRANRTIDRAIKDLGINTNTYKIVNTLK